MNTTHADFAVQISRYCAELGRDPLIVQGAGGNVSWKDGDTLWVKASGTWLAEAQDKNIFIPVDLVEMQSRIAAGEFDFTPPVVNLADARPSIETALHSLMPHKIVVHLHEVNILSHLVREGSKEVLKNSLPPSCRWALVDYFKPGGELARAVAEQIRRHPNADVIFLRNHGVVIGGQSLDEVNSILSMLVDRLNAPEFEFSSDLEHPWDENKSRERPIISGYCQPDDPSLHMLSNSTALSERLSHDWALYPDHVVFLGDRALTDYQSLESMNSSDRPSFLFLPGLGTYQHEGATLAQKLQMRCYFDVVIRQSKHQKLCCIAPAEIATLLDWDAEKYRQQLSKE